MREVLMSYGTGLAAVIGIAVAWLWLQNAWRRVVLDGSEDADVLAGRCGCLGCGGTAACERGRLGEGL